MISDTCIFEVIPGLDGCVIDSWCFQCFCIVESNCCTNVCWESIICTIFRIQIQSGFYNFILIWSNRICQVQQTDIANHKGWELANLDIYYVRSTFSGLQGK